MSTSFGKKKLNRADFMIISKQGETLRKNPGDINGIDFKIKDLHDCTVYLLDRTAQLQVDKCTNTKFIIGPVHGSIFVRDCDNCEISVACSQFRCRDLYNSKIYLYAANDPVIESSDNLTFGPFNVAYPLLDEQAKEAGFNTEINKWELIYDFTAKAGNFNVMEPENWQVETVTVDSMPDTQPVIAFPYPQKYGGIIDDSLTQKLKEEEAKDNGGMMAFGFNMD